MLAVSDSCNIALKRLWNIVPCFCRNCFWEGVMLDTYAEKFKYVDNPSWYIMQRCPKCGGENIEYKTSTDKFKVYIRVLRKLNTSRRVK